jgi:ChrR Cupin-like domain
VVCPNWRCMTLSGTPSWASSTAWAWRSCWGANRRRSVETRPPTRLRPLALRQPTARHPGPPSRPRRAPASPDTGPRHPRGRRPAATRRRRRALPCRFSRDEIADMPKPALEFFSTDTVRWAPVAEQPGVSERVLAHDPSTGMLTRVLRWEPGVDTSPIGPTAHAYVEEVLILTGSMHDVTRGETFRAGYYACRPPGMVHGPWVSADGCEMLEVRYAAPD